MTTPTGNPRGRPPGSVNKWSGVARELAASYLESAIEKAAIIAGLAMVPVVVKSGKSKGQPVMEQVFNEDGSPKMSKGKPVFKQKMERSRGAPSPSAQMDAIRFLVERAGGKPTQPMANDPDDPLVGTRLTGKVIFGPMPKSSVPANQDKSADESDEQESLTANS